MEGCAKMVVLTLLETMAGIVGLVCYYLDATFGFVLCGAFCFLGFLMNVIRGKIPGSAHLLFVVCVIIGIAWAKSMALLSGLPHFEKYLVGFLWGSCLFYPLSLVYLWILVHIFKEDLSKKNALD